MHSTQRLDALVTKIGEKVGLAAMADTVEAMMSVHA